MPKANFYPKMIMHQQGEKAHEVRSVLLKVLLYLILPKSAAQLKIGQDNSFGVCKGMQYHSDV